MTVYATLNMFECTPVRSSTHVCTRNSGSRKLYILLERLLTSNYLVSQLIDNIQSEQIHVLCIRYLNLALQCDQSLSPRAFQIIIISLICSTDTLICEIVILSAVLGTAGRTGV